MTTCKLSKIISPAFYDVHRQIKSGSVSELVAAGGRGSTKSSYISIELILTLIKHPDIHAVVLRKVANTLRTSVFAQYCWAVEALGVSKYFRRTVSPMEIVYIPTGQKIMFFGMDDPGKLKSIKVPFGYIGIAHFEELDQFDGEEQVRNVEQSIFRGGNFALCFKSFNPPAMARNWANRYVLENKAGKLIHHSTYLTTPVDWLGQKFIDDAEHLKNTNSTAYRHEYLGEVVGSGTQVFENLDIRQITDDEIKSFDRVYNGVDWGYYPDPWAFTRMQYDSAHRTLYIFDELKANKKGNQETADMLLDHGITRNDMIIADSAEPKSIADYQKFGLKCYGTEKFAGSVEYSMKWLQSLDCIVIDPDRCPNSAKEFSEYEYERDKKTGEIMEGYPDINNHFIDSTRYAMTRVWRRRGQ